jgi:hypothetical protein
VRRVESVTVSMTVGRGVAAYVEVSSSLSTPLFITGTCRSYPVTVELS